jgi:hypothetical protein
MAKKRIPSKAKRSKLARAMGKLRFARMTKKQVSEHQRKAVLARWAKVRAEKKALAKLPAVE